MNKPFIVIAAQTDANKGTHELFAAESELTDILESKGVAYVVAEGKYDGETEQSFIVFDTNIRYWLEIADKFDQISVLEVNSHGGSYLHYVSGYKSQYLGTWTEVPESEAASRGAYTKYDGKSYICK